MSGKARKAGALLLVCCVMFSNSSCRRRKREHVNRDDFVKSVEQEQHVTEWTDPVPQGMEIRYVIVRERKVNLEGELKDYRFEYDDQGRQTAYMEVWTNGSYRVECDYNNDGAVSAIRVRHEGAQGSAPYYDRDRFYTYNEKGQLISWYQDETRNGNTSRKSTVYMYDDVGRLIAERSSSTDLNNPSPTPAEIFGDDWYTYDYDKTFPRMEYRIELRQPHGNIAADYKPFEIVQRLYDEEGNPVSGDADNEERDYLDSDGLPEGWKRNYTEEHSQLTHDEHGLLIIEKCVENGIVSDITVYDYKAVLVPVNK